MPYCSPEQLADLGPLLDCLRRWPAHPRAAAGVFYLGDQPFCQFHSRNGQRWADVKRRKGACRRSFCRRATSIRRGHSRYSCSRPTS